MRLIPARAGKTPASSAPTQAHRAHPRAGGENCAPQAASISAAGSSPRGRGKPDWPLLAGFWRGLIPARAGKTLCRRGCWLRGWAHPRAGGENGLVRQRVGLASGSSPRGRGKPLISPSLRFGGRLIPARAGKTAPSSARVRPSAAHPRAGGENSGSPSRPRSSAGSSPRGRGKRGRDHRRDGPDRLIPARAGKT